MPLALLGALSQPVVIVSNPQHRGLPFASLHSVSQRAHFLRALASMLRIGE
jgi:hypothetical protein